MTTTLKSISVASGHRVATSRARGKPRNLQSSSYFHTTLNVTSFNTVGSAAGQREVIVLSRINSAAIRALSGQQVSLLRVKSAVIRVLSGQQVLLTSLRARLAVIRALSGQQVLLTSLRHTSNIISILSGQLISVNNSVGKNIRSLTGELVALTSLKVSSGAQLLSIRLAQIEQTFINLDGFLYRTTGSASGTSQTAQLIKQTAHAVRGLLGQFLNVDNLVAKTINLAMSQSLQISLRVVRSISIFIAQTQTIALNALKQTVVIQNLKSIAISTSEAVSLARMTVKSILASIANLLAQMRQPTKSLSIAQLESVTTSRRVGRLLSVASGQLFALTAIAMRLANVALGMGEAIRFSRQIGKALSVTLGEFVALSRQLGKSISFVSGEAVARLSGLSKAISVSLVEAVIVTQLRALSKAISVSLVEVVIVTQLHALSKAISILSTSSVALAHSLTKRLSVLSGEAVALSRQAGRAILLGQGQVVALSKLTSKTLAIADGQFISVTEAAVHIVRVTISLVSNTFFRLSLKVSLSLRLMSAHQFRLIAAKPNLSTIAVLSGQLVRLTSLIPVASRIKSIFMTSGQAVLSITQETRGAIINIVSGTYAFIQNDVFLFRTVGAALAQSQAVRLMSGIAKRINVAIGESVSLIKASSHAIVVAWTQAIALVTFPTIVHFFSVAISSLSSVRLTKQLSKPITFLSSENVTLRNSIAHSISVSWSEAVSVTRALAKRINVSLSQAVSRLGQIAKAISVAILSAVSLKTSQAALRTISVVSASLVTLLRQPSKPILVSHGESVAISRRPGKVVSVGIGERILIIFSHGFGVHLLQQMALKLITVAPRFVMIALNSPMVVRVTAVSNKVFSVVSNESVALQLRTAHAVRVLWSEIVTVTKQLSRRINILTAQNIAYAMISGLRSLVTAAISSRSVVRVTTRGGKVFSLLSGETVVLRRGIAKAISVGLTMAVALIRARSSLLLHINSQIAQQLRVTTSHTAVHTLMVALASGQAIILARGTVKRIAVSIGQSIAVTFTGLRLWAIRILSGLSVDLAILLARAIPRLAGPYGDLDTLVETQTVFLLVGTRGFQFPASSRNGALVLAVAAPPELPVTVTRPNPLAPLLSLYPLRQQSIFADIVLPDVAVQVGAAVFDFSAAMDPGDIILRALLTSYDDAGAVLTMIYATIVESALSSNQAKSVWSPFLIRSNTRYVCQAQTAFNKSITASLYVNGGGRFHLGDQPGEVRSTSGAFYLLVG